MLDQKDNNGSWEIACESADNGAVDNWDTSILEPTGHLSENAELWLRSVASVDEPADHDIQKNDKGCSEGRDEEPKLALRRLLLSHCITGNANDVQHGES